MSGQTILSEHDKIVNEFLTKYDPFSTDLAPAFDLRGYAKFIEDHSIDGLDITEEMMNGFIVEHRKEVG